MNNDFHILLEDNEAAEISDSIPDTKMVVNEENTVDNDAGDYAENDDYVENDGHDENDPERERCGVCIVYIVYAPKRNENTVF